DRTRRRPDQYIGRIFRDVPRRNAEWTEPAVARRRRPAHPGRTIADRARSGPVRLTSFIQVDVRFHLESGHSAENKNRWVIAQFTMLSPTPHLQFAKCDAFHPGQTTSDVRAASVSHATTPSSVHAGWQSERLSGAASPNQT